uniref:PX domain-containing protein n=1 Tax=Knipowitschia caucasica TaxID=637954 RepID=A0AAV2LV20_KNICA
MFPGSDVPRVYIRILDNEWNVYRRYTEFRELHNLLRAQFPQVDTFNFPPKKALGNKVSAGASPRAAAGALLRTS